MRWWLLACCLASPFDALVAQATEDPPVDSSRLAMNAVPCAGQTITDIVVITQPPYTARLPGDLDILRTATRKLHANTRDKIIRQYLLLNVGDKCDELRRAESERIMRGQTFLVDARIVAYSDPRGGVRLEVETRDEFSLILEPKITFGAPVLRGLRVGERNLAGDAIHVSAEWRDGRAYRSGLGARFEDYQFLGGRNVLRSFGMRNPQGHEYGLEMLRPYLTDLQRVAWRGNIGGTRTYDALLSPDVKDNAIRVDRQYQDVGAVVRVGPVGRLRLLGLSISRELVTIADDPVRVTRDGFQPSNLPEFPGLYENRDVTRLNALIGLRRLRYARVSGFDALTGVQDLRVGIQTGVLVGRSVSWLGARDRDAFVLGDVYAGYGNQHSYLGMQTLSEARRDRDTDRWEGVLTSGRIAWYLKPAEKQMWLTEVLWSTGTSVRVPYQLTFGDRDGGMHGYSQSRTSGAHRLVVRSEQRFRIPSRYRVGDFGASVFVEGGKLWAERVPFAEHSPVRGSVGIALMAAVPPKSRRMWRVDFAMPVGGDPDSRFEIRFSNADHTRTFWRDPRDMQRARERAVPTSIFTWPRNER